MQFGGPKGTIETKEWLPFDPPDKPSDAVSPQLDALIKQMTDPDNGGDYLLALWDLIVQAIPTTPFAPSDYAGYANAIVGKPLALVNAGWSLELAQPPFWQQSVLTPTPPKVIQPDKNGRLDDVVDYQRTDAEKVMSGYQFPIKIGDVSLDR
jgi:hypothetical protein